MSRVRLAIGDGPEIDVIIGGSENGLATARFEPAGERDDHALAEPVLFTNHPAGHGQGGFLESEGRLRPWRAIRTDDRIDLWIDGRVHHLRIVPRTARRSGQADTGAARAELVAPMPGTILRIAVKAGDAFEAGAPLIVMESMKMEMTITSPAAGKVGEILCSVGELVRIDQVLLRRESAEAS